MYVWRVQDCELAELRLTIDKLRNSSSIQLPASLSAVAAAAAAAGWLSVTSHVLYVELQQSVNPCHKCIVVVDVVN